MRIAALVTALALLAACTSAAPASPTHATTAAPSESLATSTPPTASPVATDSPTPSAGSSPSAAPTTGGAVGTKIEIDGYQYVTMAEAEWSEDGYSEFFEPEEGNVMYAFLLEFEGIDSEGSSYNPFYFDLLVDGFEYSYSAFGKEPALSSGDLQPGRTVRGWMSFEAPLADEVILKYEPVAGLVGDAVEWTVTVRQ